MGGRDNRGRRLLALALLLYVLGGSGCFAPSYMAPEKPYGARDRNPILQTYYAAYDTTVVLEIIPLPLCWALGWSEEEGADARDLTLGIAMPIAVLGSIVFGTIVLPFAAPYILT